MCGIAGYIGAKLLAEETVRATLRLMQQRGPDYQAAYAAQHLGQFVHLLHSRLSILDLDSRSNQPFRVGKHIIIFNGEIYNYVELRKKLIERGVELRTSSDTEVLLHYFLQHGERCVDFFEGMWSFAIYDETNGKLFFSRDRFGEKPLYLLETPRGLVFGSEIKALRVLSGARMEVNRDQVRRYLTNGHRSLYKGGETFFRGVRELPAGFNATWDSGKLTVKSYWMPKSDESAELSESEAVKGFKDRLIRSLELRLRSDVPLAFCLSGGVDSGALASIARKIFGYDVAAYSILDKDPRYREYDNVMATVNDLQCKHRLIELSYENFLPRLKAQIQYHDAPVATISYYVHALLSEAISRDGYKVVLSGTAADEILTGYYDHFLMHLAALHGTGAHAGALQNWRQHILPRVRNEWFKDPDLFVHDASFRSYLYLGQDEFASFLNEPFHEDFTETCYSENLLRNRLINELRHEIVPVILHEDDLNSMQYSLENRSPFLDRELVEFCYRMPIPFLIEDGYGKNILRKAVAGILNDRVRLDRKKIGFNASITSLLDLKDPKVRADLLADSPLFDLVRRDKFAELLGADSFSDYHNKFVFSLISTKIFLDEFSN